MPRTWIILDVSYIAYKSHHSMPFMSWQGKPTGALFGLLRSLKILESRFGTQNFCFCFDSKEKHRVTKYPWYQWKRRTIQDPVIIKNRQIVFEQLKRFRKELLPMLGYRNIFKEPGFEADDLIASLVSTLGKNKAVIYSADQDLYQLLADGISIIKGDRESRFEHEQFIRQYGIQPMHWPMVKAIAGCTSDEVVGANGVGEDTVCRYIRHELSDGKRKESLEAFIKTPKYRDNLQVVTLPWHGCRTLRPETHAGVAEQDWRLVLNELGINSLGDIDSMDQRLVRKGIPKR